MNIFFIDRDPVQAAKWMVDKHVVKMILESAQLLSTAHRVIDGEMVMGTSASGRRAKRWLLSDHREEIMYMATHVNHPSAVWCRASVQNYLWLVEHLYALLNEYTYRYGKKHKVHQMFYYLQSPPLELKTYEWTEPPAAMADEYKVSDNVVENYRNYYKVGKARMHSWKNRTPPDWIQHA